MVTSPTPSLDLAIVTRYLPADLAKSILERDPSLSAASLAAYATQLSALLNTIGSYIPPYIVAEQLRAPVCGRVVGRYLDGTMLFADVSGFTAMSERLATLGKVGAEEITRIVNTLFTTLLDVIAHYDGWLLKFGGDALTILFHGEHHAWRAVSAALDMQQAMTRFAAIETQQGIFTLQMSEGIHTGSVFAAEVGTPNRMELIVTGANVNQTARAEAAANATQVFITSATRSALADLPIVRDHGDLFEVIGLRAYAPRVDGPATPRWQAEPTADGILATIARIEALRPYLLPGVAEKIAIAPQHVEVEGELRPVTVLFAHVADFSALLERLGPTRVDEATSILQRYFAGMVEILHQHGGTVNKVDMATHGDKLMALFGAPIAYEDDPERAVRAAVAMQAAMRELADLETSAGTCSLRQKIGINTGTVFAGNVGSPSRKEYTVMGDEVNLAARLMAVAPEDAIVVSQSTWRRVREHFAGEALPPVQVKGKANPVPLIRIDRPIAKDRRPSPANQTRQVPLIGRDDELATLRQYGARALAGQGQVLAVTGEVGTGKSRLLWELVSSLTAASPAPRLIAGECQSYGQSMAFRPFVGLLRQLLDVDPAAPPDAGAQRVLERLGELAPEHVPFAGLLSALLALPIPETDVSQALTPAQRRERAFAMIHAIIAREAVRQPIVLVIEDVQWIDSSSLELLDTIVHAAASLPLLILLAYRPAFRPPWAGLPHVFELTLAELDEAHTIALLRAILPLAEVPPSLEQLVLAKTQGNPLFIEEVAKSLIERGIVGEIDGTWQLLGDLTQIDIPDTVQGVVMARIDRLAEPNRQLLQVAAVIGRRFTYQVLSGVYPLPLDIQAGLETLSHLDLIVREGGGDDPVYTFKQALIQEVAYESLLFARRRTYHRQVGDRIEAVYHDRLLEHYEILAYHYEHGEHWRKALAYDLLAGEKARRQYANQAALRYYDRIIEVLDAPERYRLRRAGDDGDPALIIPLELERVWRREALLGRGDVLALLGEFDQAIANFASALPFIDEARQRADAFLRIAQVQEHRGQYAWALDQIARALDELGADHVNPEGARLFALQARIFARQGKYDAAEVAARRSLQILADSERYGEIAFAHLVLADVHRSHASYDAAIDHLMRALALVEKLQDRRQAARIFSNLAGIYHYKGDAETAIAWLTKALEAYEAIGEVKGIAMTYNHLGIVHRSRGDAATALAYYQRSLAIHERIGDRRMTAANHLNLGEILKDQGMVHEAIAHLEQAFAIAQEIGAHEALPEYLRQLAEARLIAGESRAARALSLQALDLATRTGNRFEQAQAQIVLAQIAEREGDWPAADHAYQASIALLEQIQNERELANATTKYGLALLARRDARAIQPLARAAEVLRRLGPGHLLDQVQAALAEAHQIKAS